MRWPTTSASSAQRLRQLPRHPQGEVTLSPAMGRYLNMANNAKANPAKGIEPNENYAREVLQLFSIGLGS